MSATTTDNVTEVDLAGLLRDAHAQGLQVAVTNAIGEEHTGSLFTDAKTGYFMLVGPHRGATSNRFMLLLPQDLAAARLSSNPIQVPENYVSSADGVLSVRPGAYSPLSDYKDAEVAG